MAYTTIKKSTDYFNTKLWTGNGGTQSITGVGFQPDFTWIKERSESRGHNLTDAVRAAPKYVNSASTDAEVTTVSTTLTSFDSDGFSLGSYDDVNKNSQTYVGWSWKANGAGSANTDGTINSTVSANTTSGFSIVKYVATGSNATVGHGLGVAPAFIILKNLDSTRSWTVGSNGLTDWSYHVYLDATNAQNSDSTMFQSTAPTSTVFSVGTAAETNESGDNFIGYCFAEKIGYSKFGSYKGNGNADGTFVYTGFKPAFVIIKKTTAGDDWYMNTGKINGYNVQNDFLAPNTNAAEVVDNTAQPIDMLSNGFKMRGTGTGNNSSGVSYIYMAFASEPLVGDNPATAR